MSRSLGGGVGEHSLLKRGCTQPCPPQAVAKAARRFGLRIGEQNLSATTRRPDPAHTVPRTQRSLEGAVGEPLLLKKGSPRDNREEVARGEWRKQKAKGKGEKAKVGKQRRQETGSAGPADSGWRSAGATLLPQPAAGGGEGCSAIRVANRLAEPLRDHQTA